MGIFRASRVATRRVPAWAGFLVLGTTVVAAYYTAGRAAFPQPAGGILLYCGANLAAAAALLVGALRHPADGRSAWLLLAAAQAVYVVGDTTFYVRHDVLGLHDSPSPADALYLLRYPLLLAALYLLIRRPARQRDLAALIDAAIVTVAAALPLWFLVLAPAISTGTGPLGRLGILYQPLLNIVVLALTVRLSLGKISWSPAFVLLVAGMLLSFVSNALYSLEVAAGTYSPHDKLDLGWIGANLLLGASALHPSMVRISQRDDAAPRHMGGLRLGLLAGASLTAPAVLFVQPRGGGVDVLLVAAACMVLFALAIARLSLVLAEARTAAVTDELTGLANRELFVEQVRMAMAQARRQGTHAAVLFLDVDRFKLVNDALGHAAGDQLLLDVARRLRACLRDGDVAARHGGDEFTVLLTGLARPGDAHTAAERIRAALDTPVTIGQQRIEFSVSIGLTTGVDDADGPEDLLRYADSALYRAKDDGRNRVAAFDQTSRDSLRRKISDEAELRHALDTGLIVPWFQPLVDLRTGRIVGAEALARWIHPTDGVRLPGRFLPLAAEVGLLSAISREVGTRSHELLIRLGADLPETFRLAINLGLGELSLAEVVARSMLVTEEVSSFRRHITMEVTETALITDVAAAGPALARARAHGIAVALDDFGTGYSSLSLLRALPLDFIKLDRSFIPRMTTSPTDAAIVEATVRLGDRLGLGVIAEGVETKEQAEHLLGIGVTLAQGFHYSAAVPGPQLLAWIRDGAPWQTENRTSTVHGGGRPSDPSRSRALGPAGRS